MSVTQVSEARHAFRRAELAELTARRRLPEIERQLRRIMPRIKQLERELEQKQDEYHQLERQRVSVRRKGRASSVKTLDTAVGAKKQSFSRLKNRLTRLRDERDKLYIDAGLVPGVTLRDVERARIDARHELMVLLQKHTSDAKWFDLLRIAQRVNVPEEYLRENLLMYCDRELKHRRRIDFFFGGEKVPDGPGHGHVVVIKTDKGTINVAYTRLPGSAAA